MFFEEGFSGPNTWVQSTTVPGNQPWAILSLSPYGNYRFKVLAKNKHGESDRSPPSKYFQTDPAGKDAPTAVEVERCPMGNFLFHVGDVFILVAPSAMEILVITAPMADADCWVGCRML